MSCLGWISQTRSPSTARDAQFLVDFGLGKMRGLIHIQTMTKMTNISAYDPIQIRDQTANANKGRLEYLVQTLQGLAWRSHTSSDIWNNFSMVWAIPIIFVLGGIVLTVLNAVNLSETLNHIKNKTRTFCL